MFLYGFTEISTGPMYVKMRSSMYRLPSSATVGSIDGVHQSEQHECEWQRVTVIVGEMWHTSWGERVVAFVATHLAKRPDE
jgi:hypothetical protein